MRKMKIPTEFSPIRIELLRVAAKRRGLTSYTLDDLGPPGGFVGPKRGRLRLFGESLFHRPGDELVSVGTLANPLSDFVW
jgi:hypothetical protein